jgi:hypothetical protein
MARDGMERLFSWLSDQEHSNTCSSLGYIDKPLKKWTLFSLALRAPMSAGYDRFTQLVSARKRRSPVGSSKRLGEGEQTTEESMARPA